MGRKRSKYYIDPDDLYNELCSYKKTDIISEELGEMFIKLAKRFSTRSNFSGYSYRDEFISDAIYRMVEQINKIDLDHPNCNPFTYLTLICYNCFIAKINKEKRYQNIRSRLRDKYFDEIEAEEDVSFKRNNDENDIVYE